MSSKTRKSTVTHLSLYVGTGRELISSELPTVRDMLRFGVLLREISEEDRRNYTTEQLIGDVMKGPLAVVKG